MKKKVLILTTISGFLPQFLKGHVRILKELGAEIWYASNFDCPAYDFEPDYFEKEGIRTVSIPIERSPYRLRENAAALKTLTALIEREEIDLVHCHNPVGGILGRLAGARAKRLCPAAAVQALGRPRGYPFCGAVVFPGVPGRRRGGIGPSTGPPPTQ